MTTRLRTNFVQGTISDNPLAVGATTINAAAFADLPAVTAPDFLVLELDPMRAVGTAEIVYVTAHTAGATSVTVLRGQEGTTARAHNQGERWYHGPVAGDYWGGGQLGGGVTLYGPQTIDGAVLVANDQNLIPSGNAMQTAGGVTGFIANANSSLSYVTNGGAGLYEPGEGALRVASAAAGTCGATYNMPSISTAFPVVAYRQYWARCLVRPVGSQARSILVYITFYNAAGSAVLSTFTIAVETTGGPWTVASHVASAPGTALYATFSVEVQGTAAAGESHDFTAFGFGAGGAVPSVHVPSHGVRVSSAYHRDSEYVNNDLVSIEATGYGDQENRVTRYSDVFWSKAYWSFRRARGSKQSPTNVAAGDYIGGVRGYALGSGYWRGIGEFSFMVDAFDTGQANQAAGRANMQVSDLAGGSYGFTIYGNSKRIANNATKFDFMSATGVTIGFNRNTDSGAAGTGGAWQFNIAGTAFNLYAFDTGGAMVGGAPALALESSARTLRSIWPIYAESGTANEVKLGSFGGVGNGLDVGGSSWIGRINSSDIGIFTAGQQRVVIGGDAVFVRRQSSGINTVVLDSGAARVQTQGDQSGAVGYDLAGNMRYLIGLRSDVSGNTTDLVLYTYAGAIAMWANGAQQMRCEPGGYPWLRPPQWLSVYWDIGFQNGWNDYNNGFQGARVCKDAQGFVHIEGLIQGGTGTIFTLPAAYRPANTHLFSVDTSSGHGRVDVYPSGTVVVITGGSTYLSLEGICFALT